MSLLLQLAVRNALRNQRRSGLTALMVALGVSMLTVAMAWIQGVLGGGLDGAVRNIGLVRVTAPDFVKREQVLPIDANLAESAPIEAALRAVPTVTAVYPRIQMGVTAGAGDTIGERFGLLSGAPTAWYVEQLRLPERLLEGEMLRDDKDVLLGRAIAEQLGVHAGDEVVLLGTTQDGSLSPAKLHVRGVVDMGGGQLGRQMFVTLEQVRWMADIPDGATELLVYGPSRSQGSTLAAALRARPETAALSVQSWDERSPFDSMLSLMNTVQSVGAGVVVFITALGVLNTMMMSVLERTGEIGVLRALGLKRREVAVLFVTEAAVISLIGGMAGALLGGAMAYYLEVVGVDLGTAIDKVNTPLPFDRVVHGDLTIAMLLGSVVLGLFMAIVGGLLPALRAATVQPVEAMRARR